MLPVLPSQSGQLPSEPDWDRYFGIEVEFHPDGVPMPLYRAALYKEGIDTLDDGCTVLRARRGQGNQKPERFYAPLRCRGTQVCRGRIHHLRSVFGAMSIEDLFELLPDGALAAFRAQPVFENQSLRAILEMRHDYTNAFFLALNALFPRPRNKSRRYWDLGTDPTAGYELRSIPLKGEDGWKAIEAACKGITDRGGIVNDNCGGHIHLDMSKEDAEVTSRVFAIYRLVEPLLAAPVDPSRYFDGAYNPPAWQNTAPTGRDLKVLKTDKGAVSGWSTRWLNTAQVNHHGSFEFRGLEGTLDPATFRNYTLLLNRFIQATKEGKPWGVKLRTIMPIGVDDDSIEALFDFLDLSRDDISPPLKEVRDWYRQRVAEFKKREAFSQYLIVGGRHAKKLGSLKDMRETGICGVVPVFEESNGAEERVSNKELGIRAHRVIERLIATCVVRREYETLDGLPETVFEAFPQVPAMMDWWPALEDPDREDEFGHRWFQPEDIEFWEDRYGWLHETRTDNGTVQVIDDFWTYLRGFEVEKLGAWIREYLLDENDQPLPLRSIAMSQLFVVWCQRWARRWPPIVNLINCIATGDDSCVDF